MRYTGCESHCLTTFRLSPSNSILADHTRWETIGFDTQTDATGSTFIFPAPYTYAAAAIHANTLYSPYIYCHKNSTSTSWTAENSFLSKVQSRRMIIPNLFYKKTTQPWYNDSNNTANITYEKPPLSLLVCVLYN